MIINGFFGPTLGRVVTEVLERYRVTDCLLVHEQQVPALPAHTRALLLPQAELVARAHYDVDPNLLRPLDEQLLADMAEVETVFLRMADRLSHIGDYDYDRRKQMYLRHLRYWNHMVQEKRPRVFLSSNLPHETYDWVIHAVCRRYGVPSVFTYQTQVEDTMVVTPDWRPFAPSIAAAYADVRQRLGDVAEDQIVLAPRLQRELDRQLDKSRDPTPFYMHDVPPPSLLSYLGSVATRMRRDTSLIADQLLSPTFWREWRRLRGRRQQRQRDDEAREREYARWASPPDLGRKFIYYPLHYQPELTTSPIAGAFVDQQLAVELLAAELPDDTWIYVKEHPRQLALGRSLDVYDELRRLRRVHLVPAAFSSFELLRHCAAVATSSGTAGWEALYREKPVLLFGDSFYRAATGCHQIRDREQCRAAFQAVFVRQERPTLRDLKLFLKALEAASFEGCVDLAYKSISRLDDATSVAGILRGIEVGMRGAGVTA